MELLIEAGQMTASDYVPIYPDLPLASKGASTDAVRWRASDCSFAPKFGRTAASRAADKLPFKFGRMGGQ